MGNGDGCNAERPTTSVENTSNSGLSNKAANKAEPVRLDAAGGSARSEKMVDGREDSAGKRPRLDPDRRQALIRAHIDAARSKEVNASRENANPITQDLKPYNQPKKKAKRDKKQAKILRLFKDDQIAPPIQQSTSQEAITADNSTEASRMRAATSEALLKGMRAALLGGERESDERSIASEPLPSAPQEDSQEHEAKAVEDEAKALSRAVEDHPITQGLKAFHALDNPLSPSAILAQSMGYLPHAPEQSTPESGDVQGSGSQPADNRARKFNQTNPTAAASSDSKMGTASPEADPAVDTDDDRFWAIWTGHQEFLLRQCMRLMSGNKADAEDALSNAMLRASQKYDTYADTIINERAWLSRLVHNVCIDHFRRNKRLECRDFMDPSEPEIDHAAFTDIPQTPEEKAVTHEELRAVEHQLSKLSDKLRVPLLLRFVDGLSYSEIAEQLGLRADAVRKRIQLARDHLRSAGIRG